MNLFNSVMGLLIALDLFFHTGRPPSNEDALAAIVVFGVCLIFGFRWMFQPVKLPPGPCRSHRLLRYAYKRASVNNHRPHTPDIAG